MRPESSILRLDGGDADDLVVEHHRQAVADVRLGVAAEALAAVLATG